MGAHAISSAPSVGFAAAWKLILNRSMWIQIISIRKPSAIIAVGWALIAAAVVATASADSWDDAARLRSSQARATAAVIDHTIAAAQREADLAPSPIATDAEFLRRITLDLTGRIPEGEMAHAFLASRAPDKREQIVARLMRSEEYRQGSARLWTLWLIGREPEGNQVNRHAFRQWVREDVIAPNMPHDQFVAEIITAEGRNDEVGAAP